MHVYTLYMYNYTRSVDFRHRPPEGSKQTSDRRSIGRVLFEPLGSRLEEIVCLIPL